MACIRPSDLISSVESALQYISYYHPVDFIQAMTRAYEMEESPAAKGALAQILINSRMVAEGHRPICQDTGIVCAFVKVGMDVTWEKSDLTVQDMVDEGTRRAYQNPDNPLRASVVSALGKRENTRDNTPAVVHTEMVPGDRVEVEIAAKGGGSEFKSKFTVLNPSDNIAEWVTKMVPTMGAGWCPPGVLGIGVGGTAEKAMVLAKEAINEPIDMPELLKRGPRSEEEALRIDVYSRVNDLGIGAQGLGGLTTVLDVKVRSCPTHAAMMPVAVIPNCAATRHVHFVLDGSGPAVLEPPSLEHWPIIDGADATSGRRLRLDELDEAAIGSLKAGDHVLLSGKLLTGRDAAHKRLQDLAQRGEPIPVDFKNRFIYYVGPVNAVGDEAVGPAGPTTATRMDKFTDFMLDEMGVLGMVGKAERGPATVGSLKQHKRVYLIGVGGAAYLISKAVRSAKVLAFEDLGMEAIYEFDVVDMPVMVAVDTQGTSVHVTGPKAYRGKWTGKQLPVLP